MSRYNPIGVAVRRALIIGVAASSTLAGQLAVAQDQDSDKAELTEVVVTGSRIARQDYEANSPLTTVTAEQIVQNADITLDTYLNTLPQVSPAGSTASNNPGNAGQSNVDLRALGANRNLVLIDGRRPMVSASNLTVDLNTIPQALIERIEVITGGAGAAYGADAIAGVVNIRLKENFEGLDLRASYSNSSEEWDSQDVLYSAVLGANFADDRGNAVISLDYAEREPLIKAQRLFSAIATSTTGAVPEGRYIPSTNAPTQASIDALFTRYGFAGRPVAASDGLSFNLDGSLFSIGAFNSPRDVLNWRYPVDLVPNTRFFPDFYSYNFDAVNLLVLPLERRSFMGKFDFEFSEKLEAFAQVGWTEYKADTALAPTPVPSGLFKNPATPGLGPTDVLTSLVPAGAAFRSSGGFIVPLNNTTIPADLRTLLATRTGDNVNLTGTGATEPILVSSRTLSAGLRSSTYENTVVQYLFGLRGPLFGETWRWEAYASEGRTEIDRRAAGNINVQTVQSLLERDDSGAGICAGGINLFGRNPISSACLSRITVVGQTRNEFLQQIGQAYVTGEIGQLPAGPVSVVVGAEHRGFRYDFDPGALSGPIAGFNTAQPVLGRNKFNDIFTEALVPLTDSIELSLGYRFSDSEFRDITKNLEGGSSDSTYKVELSWQPFETLRGRFSYQRAVRAPNFTELFDSGNTFPQFFDPCASNATLRQAGSPVAAQLRALCVATGIAATAVDSFIPLPGGQAGLFYVGNTDLSPEEADSITLGIVWNSPWGGALEGLRGSLDYYRVDIDNVILQENINLLISDCYNLTGSNPNYDANRNSCRAVRSGRTPALNNAFVSNPLRSDGQFPLQGGTVKIDGIDAQVDYSMPIGPGKFSAQLLLSYMLGFEQQDRPEFASIDYSGTIAFFGEGLGVGGGGGSAPKIRANLQLGYQVGDFGFDVRGRYIDSMDNRASRIFPGEATFTGVPSITYWDLGANWRFTEKSSVRLGVNNVFNKEPALYAPNVQSGTDPSLYDVIGRRVFAQVNFRF